MHNRLPLTNTTAPCLLGTSSLKTVCHKPPGSSTKPQLSLSILSALSSALRPNDAGDLLRERCLAQQEPCPCPPKPALCQQELIWRSPASSGQLLVPNRCVVVTVPGQTGRFPRSARRYHIRNMASSTGTARDKAGDRIWASRF